MTVAIELDRDTQLVVTRGREAWRALRREETWENWVMVGRAIEAGKNATMRALHTNNPNGRVWSDTFGAWLRETGFDEIDKGTRSRLQTSIESLPDIERWRQTLPLGQRLQLNHPNTVVRHWKAATHIPKPDGDGRSSVREENIRLREELDVHKRKVRPFEDGDRSGPQMTLTDAADDVAQGLLEFFGPTKAAEVISALTHAAAERALTSVPARKVTVDDVDFRQRFWAVSREYLSWRPRRLARVLNCTFKLAEELYDRIHTGTGVSEKEFVWPENDEDDEDSRYAGDDYDDDDL